MRVGCADEAEAECVDALQRHFARYLLPDLKFASKSVFRIANLGGRYEWGAVRIAESHFALARGAEDWKIVLVKLNAHVAVTDDPSGPAFGALERYGTESDSCGALSALLAGGGEPFENGFTEDFSFEGVDRLSLLRESVALEHRQLFAAVTSARLQARRAMIDLQDHHPKTPTVYLVVPSVTLNRRGHDTEIVVGIYRADRRGEVAQYEYTGLGDRPDRYRLSSESSALRMSDPELGKSREARDHRALVRELWRAEGRPGGGDDQRIERAIARTKGARGPLAKAAVTALVPVLAEVAPVPAAALLFGHGVVRVHHAARAHRLLREAEKDDEARLMLADLESRIEGLDPERAEHVLELLRAAYA